MKVSTRCDIGLPFRPPEVIARRENIPPSPPPPYFVSDHGCRKREMKVEGEKFKKSFRISIIRVIFYLDSWRLSLRREYRIGISGIEKCITGYARWIRRDIPALYADNAFSPARETIRIDNETRPRLSRVDASSVFPLEKPRDGRTLALTHLLK